MLVHRADLVAIAILRSGSALDALAVHEVRRGSGTTLVHIRTARLAFLDIRAIRISRALHARVVVRGSGVYLTNRRRARAMPIGRAHAGVQSRLVLAIRACACRAAQRTDCLARARLAFTSHAHIVRAAVIMRHAARTLATHR